MKNAAQHKIEIDRNVELWARKPLLHDIYRHFWTLISGNMAGVGGLVVEIGSGVGGIKAIIPQCIRTDIFPGPGIDRVENAYRLSFKEQSVANLVLFDVFHHLRYPGTAMQEFRRVLAPGGRILVFDPCLSLLGVFVYGLFHHEPLGLRKTIQWLAPEGWVPEKIDYYAAQANATRVFARGEFSHSLRGWTVVKVCRLSAISYLMSGGYSKPQLYPDLALPFMRHVDAVCDLLPSVFATRLPAVIEKG